MIFSQLIEDVRLILSEGGGSRRRKESRFKARIARVKEYGFGGQVTTPKYHPHSQDPEKRQAVTYHRRMRRGDVNRAAGRGDDLEYRSKSSGRSFFTHRDTGKSFSKELPPIAIGSGSGTKTGNRAEKARRVFEKGVTRRTGAHPTHATMSLRPGERMTGSKKPR